jgi:16S rRNA (cytidine1402-2'-O)-methyltransferase
MKTTGPPGPLLLMPNALDLGSDEANAPPLDAVLPRGVIERAANIGHWVAENARSARALLKRVHAIAPLARPLQEIAIAELPRPQGQPRGRAGVRMGCPAGPRAGRPTAGPRL